MAEVLSRAFVVQGPDQGRHSVRIRTTLLGTAVALALAALAGPVGAQAQVAEPGSYGGGRIDSRFVPGSLLSAPVSLRVARDGRSLKFHAGPNIFCDRAINGMTGFFNDAVLDARIRRDGTFRGTRRLASEFQNRPADTLITFSGDFDRGGVADGFVRLRQTVRADDGSTLSECDSGQVRWRAVKPGSPRRISGSPPARSGFYGTTSQNGVIPSTVNTARERFRFPFALRVSRDGRRVETAFWLWKAACSGEPLGIPLDINYSPSGRIGRNRTFVIPETFGRDRDANSAETTTVDFRGRLGSRLAAGTFRMRTTVIAKSTGEVLDRCDTGTVRWRAQRRR